MRRPFVTALAVALAASQAFAQVGPGSTAPGPGPRIGGDNPLKTLKTISGPFDAKVFVLAHNGVTDPAGTFDIQKLASGSKVQEAYLYVTSFNDNASETAELFFDGTSFGQRSPDAEDEGGTVPSGNFYCRMYRFDVSSKVTGNRSYDFNVVGIEGSYATTLLIVNGHPHFPFRRIVINDGAENLLDATTSTTFDGMSAGKGLLQVFTAADNVGGVETVTVNGNQLASGDIFNANRGDFASFRRFTLDVVDGTNSFDLSTFGEWLGLHLAVLSSPFECVALWMNYGSGHPGTLGIPELSSDSDPVLGTVVNLTMGNSSGIDAAALVLLGFQETDLLTRLEGHILVIPFRIYLLPIPAGGLVMPVPLSDDLQFCGLPVYLQTLQFDQGASRRVSFSPGLLLLLGL